jgi:hypothetical protein
VKGDGLGGVGRNSLARDNVADEDNGGGTKLALALFGM